MSATTPKINPQFAVPQNGLRLPLRRRRTAPAKITVRNLNFYYGRAQALYDISLDIPERIVMALIGPSGCGKSTFLRTLNRMNDVIPATRVEGEVTIDGRDIYGPGTDVVDLRRRVGMVFQKSNPFPKSIFDNVAYGLRINRITAKQSRTGGPSRAGTQRRSALDRSKGPFAGIRARPFGRATAAIVHRAGAGYST